MFSLKVLQVEHHVLLGTTTFEQELADHVEKQAEEHQESIIDPEGEPELLELPKD
jgi:hypothetical protein